MGLSLTSQRHARLPNADPLRSAFRSDSNPIIHCAVWTVWISHAPRTIEPSIFLPFLNSKSQTLATYTRNISYLYPDNRTLHLPAFPQFKITNISYLYPDNRTLHLPAFPQFKITSISYLYQLLTLDIGSISLSNFESSPCSLQNLSSFVNSFAVNLSDYTNYLTARTSTLNFVRCSKKITPVSNSIRDYKIAGPIPSCYEKEKHFVYVVDSYEYMDVLGHDCKMFWNEGMIPEFDDRYYNFVNNIHEFIAQKEVKVNLYWDGQGTYECSRCEEKGEYCGYDWGRNQTFCFDHASNVFLITGASISGFLILLAVAFILLYITRRSAKEKETWLKVEKFLATYKTTKPTRYTFARLKKITKRFRYKLGQGGFGSVYKGELPNGIPVAVKMLENSKGEGEEFINEVSTMGRIHHFNVVRLLGFCSEGRNRALIYEFMPNQSLEKYIFLKEGSRFKGLLNMEQMLDIAIGVARGIEYLHQGCDQRIMHFDIKPHNILLDHNFNPKVSDFGLAKLCARDQSIVTMTAARGTMGYIAPEIFSRNFGEVSYKSDIYSFGMLLFEIVSGKRTVEPMVENQDEVYFPEWIYYKLVDGGGIGLDIEKGKEEDIVRKLVIVALWCIQLNPNDRPTMTKVLQFLTDSLESLQIPPKPFFSTCQAIGS